MQQDIEAFLPLPRGMEPGALERRSCAWTVIPGAARRLRRILHPATRLLVEADVHVDELAAATAAESRDDVRERLVPPGAAMAREKRRSHFARMPAGAAGHDQYVVPEVIAQSLDGIPGKHEAV